MVAFEDGDPDRPLITGSVYNDMNRPPVELPANADSCGFKSCTWGEDPLSHFGSLVFHDTADNEHVELHSQSNLRLTGEFSRVQVVPGPNMQFEGPFPSRARAEAEQSILPPPAVSTKAAAPVALLAMAALLQGIELGITSISSDCSSVAR